MALTAAIIALMMEVVNVCQLLPDYTEQHFRIHCRSHIRRREKHQIFSGGNRFRAPDRSKNMLRLISHSPLDTQQNNDTI
jgi:hypothetical protein